jgi:Na+/H+ antiporter NhaD/arsenite permease-like protein
MAGKIYRYGIILIALLGISFFAFADTMFPPEKMGITIHTATAAEIQQALKEIPKLVGKV